MKRTTLIFLLLAMILSVSPQQAAQQTAIPGTIRPDVAARIAAMQSQDTITVIVRFRDQADLSGVRGNNRFDSLRLIIEALQAKAKNFPAFVSLILQQRSAQGKVVRYKPFWIFNGMSVTATADTIVELAQDSQVADVSTDEAHIVPLAAPQANPELNLSLINAPAVWNLGYTGQGVVVASLDTGVDANHPDLAARWRGGTNSWFDPYNQHPNTPVDLDGHGTATMGVMVGGSAGGTSIGVASGAQWIAARIFNDTKGTDMTAIHSAFQWLLDPDGNPATADAPDIVNNSWGFTAPGCFLDFEADLQALRSAGILPIFAAGNGGPNPATSLSPANNPSAFAVGAVDNSDAIYSLSSRGPSTCTGRQELFPDVVAPGVAIRSSYLNDGYALLTGTSLAAPHVSGTLALLLSACSGMTVDQQAQALRNSALDLGDAGPDPIFGYGRIDALAALDYVKALGCVAPPAPPLTLACAAGTGSKGTPYSSSLVASGGTAPYRFAIETGGLPPGLILDPNTGAITGTPQSAGTYPYTAVVTDSASGTALSARVNCSITITTPVQPLTLACPCSEGRVDSAYSSALTASGGTTPYRFSIAAGSLPSGLRLDPATGAVTGIPKKAGTSTFAAKVTDSTAGTPLDKTANCSIAIAAAPQPSVLHVGDLDKAAKSLLITWWATVTVRVHDDAHAPVPGALVTGSWSEGLFNTGFCVTGKDGSCDIYSGPILRLRSSTKFTVKNVYLKPNTYDARRNHDPDGDSNGTVITISKPK